MDTVVPDFTGSETPSDVARAAIEWFSQRPNSGITIFHENSIPKLKYELQSGAVDCVCIFRLDIMLESFYSDAEHIFDENVRAKFVNAAERATLLPYIAFSGMTTMLSRLVGLQTEMFLEAFDETTMLTAGTVLHSLLAQSKHGTSLSRPASKIVQGWIEDCVAGSIKKKREFLVGFMNTQRFLHIPTSVGRPPGTTKPTEKKEQEAVVFAAEVEAAIRSLYVAEGKMPTKTAVAQSRWIQFEVQL